MKIIKKNRRVRYDYTILQTYVSGIILVGAEVKEVKSGHIDISESYVRFRGEEPYLWNSLISQPKYAELIPDRTRKLLLRKREIADIQKFLQQKGYTCVPTAIGIEHGLVKIEIAIVRGKKKYDKREAIKKRETDRILRRMEK